MKRILGVFLTIAIALTVLPISCFAETIVASGSCGTDVSWKLTGSGNNLTLTMSGDGHIDDYTNMTDKTPWHAYANRITTLYLKGAPFGNINIYTFYDLLALKTVKLEYARKSGKDTGTIRYWCDLNNYYFQGSPNLTTISIEKSQKDPNGYKQALVKNGALYTVEYRENQQKPNYTLHWVPCGLKASSFEVWDDDFFTYGAFFNCKNIKSIIFPIGINNDWDAHMYYPNQFDGCTSLENIYFKGSYFTFSKDTFTGFDNVNIYIPEHYRDDEFIQSQFAQNVTIIFWDPSSGKTYPNEAIKGTGTNIFDPGSNSGSDKTVDENSDNNDNNKNNNLFFDEESYSVKVGETIVITATYVSDTAPKDIKAYGDPSDGNPFVIEGNGMVSVFGPNNGEYELSMQITGKKEMAGTPLTISVNGYAVSVDINVRDFNFDLDTLGFKSPAYNKVTDEEVKFLFPTAKADQIKDLIKGSNGGLCHGMTSFCINMNSPFDLMSPEDFGRLSVSDIKKTDKNQNWNDETALKFIKLFWIFQCHPYATDQIDANKDKLTELYNAVKKSKSVGLGINISVSGLVFFKQEHHSLWGIKVIDKENESKILVYDSNYPKQKRYLTLKKDENNNFVSWSYDTGLLGTSTWGTGKKEASISYSCDAEVAYGTIYLNIYGTEIRGIPEYTDLFKSAETARLETLKQNLLVVHGCEANDSSAKEIWLEAGVDEKEGTNSEEKVKGYWTKNKRINVKSNGNGISAKFSDNNSYVSAKSSSGKTAALYVVDNNKESNINLNTEKGDQVTLEFCEYINGSPVAYSISGTAEESTISAEKDENNIVFSGMTNIKATVNGKAIEVESVSEEKDDKNNSEILIDKTQNNPITTTVYSDIPNGKWYTDAVYYCRDKGYMAGKANNKFDPNGKVTRATITQVLYAMEGKPTVKTKTGFKDLKDGSWYVDSVNWAASIGIVSGYSKDKFGPNDAITRQQMAAIMYQYAKYKGYDTKATADLSKFKDSSSITKYAVTPMKWAVGYGIISGTNKGLEPKGTATRAQIAVILQAFDKKVRK